MDTTATLKLTEQQLLMLQMSDLDIENGRLITQEQLDKDDLQLLSDKVKMKTCEICGMSIV